MTNKAIFLRYDFDSAIRKYLIAEMPSLNFLTLICASVSSEREIWGTSIVIPLTRQLIQSNVGKLGDMLKEICPILAKGALGEV